MDVTQILKRQEQLDQDRSNWETRWQDCADYAMPQNSQISTQRAKGQKPNIDLYDTTAEESNIQLAAGLYSYMFPTDGRAFVLEIGDTELKDNDNIKQWLEQTTTILHKYLVGSNFRQAFFEFLKSLGCFGTACLHEEKGKKVPIVFKNHFMGSIFIAANSDGIIDTVHRKFEFTARQAVQEYGKENLGEKILADFKSKKSGKKFKFLHAIYPREDYDPSKDGPTDMPFASKTISLEDKKIVKDSGYTEMPCQVDRFDKDAYEDYGRSPTMKKLPDIKMVNKMQKTRIKGWEKQVDPPTLLPDDGSIWPLATQPGGVIFYRAGGDKPDYWEFKGSLADMEAAILTVQQTIQKGYFIDMFDPLIDRQNMTATEVMARVEQKMRFLTPIIGRLQSELFNPMIHRMIGILSRQELLPEMPPELSEKEFSVMYLGRLALALRTLESEGLNQLMLEWAPMMETTNVLDNLDKDVAFRESSRNRGVSATWLVDIKTRDEKRAADAEAAQQQAMLQAMPEMAKAAKAGGTAPEEGSITERAMNGIG